MRIVPRHERHEQRAQDLAYVIAIVEAADPPTIHATTHKHRNLQGDTRVLRMIPVTARGVGGTIPGTEGCQAAIANEQRKLRNLRNVG